MPAALPPDEMTRYLDECRELVLEELREIIPPTAPHSGQLYELMMDYPMRDAKALRPGLCIATCRALGGPLEAVLRSAAVLELYHNAFLIHDDVEDDSEMRRKGQTLHRLHGVPTAINVGDGMLALALTPLLENTRLLGLGRALRIVEAVSDMARVSAEGQALELAWIREGRWDLSDRSYVRLVYQKSAWYTFLTPVTVGAIVAGAGASRVAALCRAATLLGVAFQIRDDVLNLQGDEGLYGKEIEGDLWEGKHTLILMHAIRSSAPDDQQRARRILRKPRPVTLGQREDDLRGVVYALAQRGELSQAGSDALLAALERDPRGVEAKSAEDVAFLRSLIDAHGSIEYASAAAERRARRAARLLAEFSSWLPESVHSGFLSGLVAFIVDRRH